MSLVNWKTKRDKYDDEDADEDDDAIKGVRFNKELKGVRFIKSDSENARAMKAMGGKWKW